MVFTRGHLDTLGASMSQLAKYQALHCLLWQVSRVGTCRWGLGVLLYVLLTGRQPFSSPKTDDPMVVMRRIVDDNWHIKYPPYLSPSAKVRCLRQRAS